MKRIEKPKSRMARVLGEISARANADRGADQDSNTASS